MIYIRKSKIIFELAGDAIIWVEPSSVLTFAPKSVNTRINKLKQFCNLDPVTYGTPNPTFKRFFYESFVINKHSWIGIVDINQTKHFELVSDLIDKLPDFKRSAWYDLMAGSIKTGAGSKHKRILISSQAELDTFFKNYVIPLINEIKSNGYDTNKYEVEGRCLIGPSGEIVKTLSGRYRFAIAKICGVKRFPLKVSGVHEQWYEEYVGKKYCLEILRKAIRTRSISLTREEN